MYHTAVLLRETVDALHISGNGIYVDCTAGGGGHSSAALEQLEAGGLLIAIDRDPDALAEAGKKLENTHTAGTYKLVRSEFADIDRVLAALGIDGVDGIMADLGVSSAQIDRPERGFSFQNDGPLDMRMDPEAPITAADIVNNDSEESLREIFHTYGEERYARRIAAAIVARRRERPFTRTADLVDVIARNMPAKSRREQHPAKRCFQALRIAVNGELKQLEDFLDKVPDLLNDGGRLAVITFHSLEDRMVKQIMRKWEDPCECPKNMPCVCHKKPLGKIIHRKGIVATEEEQQNNPRSRSARLRVFERNSERRV